MKSTWREPGQLVGMSSRGAGGNESLSGHGQGLGCCWRLRWDSLIERRSSTKCADKQHERFSRTLLVISCPNRVRSVEATNARFSQRLGGNVPSTGARGGGRPGWSPCWERAVCSRRGGRGDSGRGVCVAQTLNKARQTQKAQPSSIIQIRHSLLFWHGPPSTERDTSKWTKVSCAVTKRN